MDPRAFLYLASIGMMKSARCWTQLAVSRTLAAISLAAVLLASPASAESKRVQSRFSSFVITEQFKDHDEARDYILNYDLTAVMVYSEGRYYVAKGPLTNQEQISSAIAAAGRTARQQGSCRRFAATPGGSLRGFWSTGFKKNYSDYTPQKYRGISEVNLQDDRPIAVYDLSGISSFYGTDIKIYQSVDCPTSFVNPDFWEQAKGEMSRQYFDITDIRQSGSWRSIDVIEDYDYKAKKKDSEGNDFTYYSKQLEYIFQCDLEKVDYAIIQNEMYFSGGFTEGEMLYYSDTYSVSRLDFSSTINALTKICSMPAQSRGIDYIDMYNKAISDRRDRDQKLAEKAAEEELRQLEYEERNAPRGYYLSCYSDDEYQNTIVRRVNCSNANSILSSLQWAWQTLRQHKPEFADTCYNAIADLRRLASTAPHVIPDAAGGFLGQCNIGLAWVKGPSKAQSSR